MPKRPAETNLVRETFLKNVATRLKDIPDAESCLRKVVLLRNSFIKVNLFPSDESHDTKRRRVE